MRSISIGALRPAYDRLGSAEVIRLTTVDLLNNSRLNRPSVTLSRRTRTIVSSRVHWSFSPTLTCSELWGCGVFMSVSLASCVRRTPYFEQNSPGRAGVDFRGKELGTGAKNTRAMAGGGFQGAIADGGILGQDERLRRCNDC